MHLGPEWPAVSRRLARGSAAHVEVALRLAGLQDHLGDTLETDKLLKEATVAAYKDSRFISIVSLM